MVRQPDLKTVAAKLRQIVGAHQGETVGHQKSLNLAAELFGFKNWAHYEQTGLAQVATPAPATPLAGPQSGDLDLVYETLEWVAHNYQATLAGKPVRDADECLSSAERLLKLHNGSEQRFTLSTSFTFFTETSPNVEFAEGPTWVEVTIDQALLDAILSMRRLCVAKKLVEAGSHWAAENWEPEGADGDFNMRGETLVVAENTWRLRAYPKHCDYDVQTRSMEIASLLKAIEAKQDGKPDSNWTAYKWVGDVLLYSGSGDVSGLQARLEERGILPETEDAQDS